MSAWQSEVQEVRSKSLRDQIEAMLSSLLRWVPCIIGGHSEESLKESRQKNLHLVITLLLRFHLNQKCQAMARWKARSKILLIRLVNNANQKLRAVHTRAFMAACLFNRSDDALCLQVLKHEFMHVRHGTRGRFEICRKGALTSYTSQVVTLLQRAPALQNAALDYLTAYPILSMLKYETSSCKQHISKVLLNQLDRNWKPHQVTHLLGTLARDDRQARAGVFMLLQDSDPHVRINAIHTLVHISETDNDCFKGVLSTSYDKTVNVRAEAIKYLGRMFWARNLHKEHRAIDTGDFEALSIVLGALDHADQEIEHAAVQAVKSLEWLATPGMVESLRKKLWHPVMQIKWDTLKAYAFHMRHLGRSALPELVMIMTNQMEPDENRHLASVAIVSAGYGEHNTWPGRRSEANQYSDDATRGLIMAAGLEWDVDDASGIAETAIIGLVMMAPRNLWPHRQLICMYWNRYQQFQFRESDCKKEFGEVVDAVHQWERQVCAWALVSNFVILQNDVRLAILVAFLDTHECTA